VRNTFHVTLHQLRRALGAKEAITFDDGAYALARGAAELAGVRPAGAARAPAAAGARCDVDAVLSAASAVCAADREAERRGARGAAAVDAVLGDGADRVLAAWRRALDLAARGALGEGLDAGAWLAPHQARVAGVRGEGLEALARLHARRGATGQAAAVLEALVAAEPLREAAHRALMATYAAAGEPARALAHYDALAALLAREVGAAPGARHAGAGRTASGAACRPRPRAPAEAVSLGGGRGAVGAVRGALAAARAAAAARHRGPCSSQYHPCRSAKTRWGRGRARTAPPTRRGRACARRPRRARRAGAPRRPPGRARAARPGGGGSGAARRGGAADVGEGGAERARPNGSARRRRAHPVRGPARRAGRSARPGGR
jgi:DNA-binding SARP family transcriptional activator